MRKKFIQTLFILFVPTLSFAQSIIIDSSGGLGETSDSSPVSNESSIETLVRNTLNEKFDYLKYNDLRDVMSHDQLMPGTSKHILIDIANDPMKYAGVDVGFYLDKGAEISPMGPLGHVGATASGKKVFNVTDTRGNRRRDAILGVSYERIWDMTGEDKVFDIDLMLFIHSTANGGYYFRKVNIQTTWNEKIKVPMTLGTTDIAKTTIKKVISETHLSDTDFEVHVELASQKVILFDRRHGITRVFPVTAGALDIRTQGIQSSGVINSMTLLLPGRKGDFADFNLESSVLIKRSLWASDANQESRVEPSYYKGRPFMGIIDKTRVAKAGNYHEGYRQVGFHYQIDDSGLKRGFESHGCLRLQDHDLYFLDAIVNGGSKDMVPVEVKMTIGKFKNLDSVYRRQKTYNKVVYTSRPSSPETIKCENKPNYPVRFFDNGYHTVADSDCLTKVIDGGESLQDSVNYLLGQSSFAPTPFISNDVNHASVSNAINEVKDPKYDAILVSTFNATFPNTSRWIGDLNQEELELLLTRLKQNLEMGGAQYADSQGYGNQNTYDYGNQYGQAPQAYNVQVWPTFYCPRNAPRTTLTNVRNYNNFCKGRAQAPNRNTPARQRPRVGNCGEFFNAILNAGCGYR